MATSVIRASEGTLNRWSRLQFAVVSTHSRFVVVKILVISESLSQHDENMLYRPHLVG
jgi:hypothetical protein